MGAAGWVGGLSGGAAERHRSLAPGPGQPPFPDNSFTPSVSAKLPHSAPVPAIRGANFAAFAKFVACPRIALCDSPELSEFLEP
jgi:hypothetical protein